MADSACRDHARPGSDWSAWRSFLLASCFWHDNDREGTYLAAVRQLTKQWSPAFKLLLGKGEKVKKCDLIDKPKIRGKGGFSFAVSPTRPGYSLAEIRERFEEGHAFV
jgi:hypothetical protein